MKYQIYYHEQKLIANARLCSSRLKIFRYDGDRAFPVSTRNTDEPLKGSFKIRISDFSREAATWRIGLKGGFGFIAMIDFVSFAST